MRPIPKVFLFFLVLALLVPRSVSAGDYTTDAIEALQSSSVYVAQGTPGTDDSTQSYLRGFLSEDDRIVLVMLPAAALEGTDMYSIAQEISAGLDNQKTIGLAVGRETIGYSPILPEGVAADKMARADSVSNDPITALITFTQNIHAWLAKNPQPTPSPTPKPTPVPIELPKVEDISWPIWTIFGLFALAVVGISAVKANQTIKRQKVEAQRRKRRETLNPIELQIRELENNITRIRDRTIRGELEEACKVAYGLLEIFQESQAPLGLTEAGFPSILSCANRQVIALIRHESGRRPQSSEYINKLKTILMNYDNLFIKFQRNDPEATDLLASMMQAESAMISQIGYLEQ